jgi:RHS repeat-associated protein
LEKGNTKYAYDLVANLTNIDYPSSTDVKLQYDALNRLTKMIDASGTNTYSYTAAGQILTEDGPFASDTVTNTYVNRLRTALSLQQPSGVWTNGFIYDAARRLTNVTSSAGSFGNVYVTGVGGASGYSSSLLQQLLLGNGSVITNNFDPVGRLLATHLRTSAGVLTNKHEYLYDLAGQRTNETRMDASTLVYSHDKIGQLKVSDSSVNSEDRGYFYDSAWNLNRRTNNGATYTFTVDNKNQLTSDPNCADYYDGNGNLTRRTLYGADYNIYSYDDENRLVSMSFLYGAASSQWQTVWSYDGLGRLRSRVDYTYSNGGGGWLYSTTTCYIYDGFRVIQERDGNNTPAVSYTRGNDLSGSFEGAGGIGGLLARSSGYSSGNFTSHAYYHADAGGNITFMLNSSQSMVAKYRYDPFGNTISSSGSLWGANLYRFSSKEIHAPSGMYYYLYRFYDPYLQRWINRDPLQEWGGLNLYTFVLNSPVISVDALGKSIYDDLSNTNCIAQLRKPKLMPLTQSRADQQLLVQASKQALEYEKTVYKKSKQHLENWEFLEAVNVFLAEDGRILPFPIERPPGAKPKDK